MIKKLIVSLLVVTAAIGTMSTGASAKWKEGSYKNWSWIENGAEAKGWKQIDGQWYNFGNNGEMVTGWMKDNGSWYYFWSNGMMAESTWLWNGGYWYYFDADGKLVLDSVVSYGKRYDFTAPEIIVSYGLDAKTTTSASVVYNNN